MKLEKYISDLLYRYDLVIVPNFGGIIGRRKPARLDRDTYIFSPPYKDLSFNVQLQQNDGLLANYIADVTGMSYAESLKAIKETVQEWHRILQEEKRLKIDQIGIFNLIADDKILFLPLTTRNFLAEAYGLTAFVYKPLMRQPAEPAVNEHEVKQTVEPAKPVEKQSVEEDVFEELTTEIPVQKSRNDYRFWKYAAVFVVGLGLFTAGIGMLRHYNQVQDEPVFQKATFVLKQDFPAVKISTPGTKTVKKVEKAVKPEAPADKYFIISGAFRDKTNAEKKIQMLKKAGYPATIAGQNKLGLWLVAYQGFASHDDAVQTLNNLKKQHPGVWIFNKK